MIYMYICRQVDKFEVRVARAYAATKLSLAATTALMRVPGNRKRRGQPIGGWLGSGVTRERDEPILLPAVSLESSCPGKWVSLAILGGLLDIEFPCPMSNRFLSCRVSVIFWMGVPEAP